MAAAELWRRLMRPQLMLNPSGDAAFVAAVERAHDEAGTPAALAHALRGAYPAVVVRPRSLSGEVSEVWYVYRDGHWVDHGEGGPGDVRDRGRPAHDR